MNIAMHHPSTILYDQQMPGLESFSLRNSELISVEQRAEVNIGFSVLKCFQ